MSDAETGPVLYAEDGSTWWPVAWGPVFAGCGLLVELLTPGVVNLAAWLLLAGVLGVAAAAWVYARRRALLVLLTPTLLTVGREDLEIARIAAITDVGAPMGVPVLGGGFTPPKGMGEIPLRLADDRVVLAWAKDPAALLEELRPLLVEP
ncbi:MAG: hypothetical protein IJH84_14475 [Saccharopolyspora sp.]|uniref:hypothetical protein n=1 Tax=Saccharopolyspora sp. TaxID=33915 RepID=UPI0025E20ECE|nr:hypothetical protein [Saccharopolyspora sp.]MBQ6642219.1 hypothetical protein [Saccharopolyspora sp.]